MASGDEAAATGSSGRAEGGSGGAVKRRANAAGAGGSSSNSGAAADAAAAAAAVDSGRAWAQVLGPKLVRHTGHGTEPVDTAEALRGKHVGLYFSAHW